MRNTKNKTIEINSKFINKHFRIKVFGFVNGVKINKLVGVSGLLEILGTWERVVKFVTRAWNAMADVCHCKIYGGATISFYSK